MVRGTGGTRLKFETLVFYFVLMNLEQRLLVSPTDMLSEWAASLGALYAAHEYLCETSLFAYVQFSDYSSR